MINPPEYKEKNPLLSHFHTICSKTLKMAGHFVVSGIFPNKKAPCDLIQPITTQHKLACWSIARGGKPANLAYSYNHTNLPPHPWPLFKMANTALTAPVTI